MHRGCGALPDGTKSYILLCTTMPETTKMSMLVIIVRIVVAVIQRMTTAGYMDGKGGAWQPSNGNGGVEMYP